MLCRPGDQGRSMPMLSRCYGVGASLEPGDHPGGLAANCRGSRWSHITSGLRSGTGRAANMPAIPFRGRLSR